jgi:hypothetical protein
VSVTITGSLLGDGKLNSGSIVTDGKCASVTIKGDIVGGFGPDSGSIISTQDIASVTVGGSLIAGDGNGSGTILSVQGAVGPVKIGRNVEGGMGNFAGLVSAGIRIESVSVSGSLLGGPGEGSGRIESFGAIGTVKIGGGMVGGDGLRSGTIDAATTLGAVTLGGSLRGGNDDGNSGVIRTGGAMGSIKIEGDIIAGNANGSGKVDSGGTLASVTVGGSLDGDASRHGAGGSVSDAGQILSVGAMGPVRIGGDVLGGFASQTGRIVSMDTIASVTLGGSLLGNSSFTGEILSTGALGPVKIGGNIVGNFQSDVGFQVAESGYIQGQRIASLFVGGSIKAGVDATSGVPQKVGSVRAVDDIGPIFIKGSLLGTASNDGDSSDGDFTAVVISARGQGDLDSGAKNDVAIKSIKIGGRVEQSQILAGYDTVLVAKNADAQIGFVRVGGDWVASNLVAGAVTGSGGFFGDANDVEISGAGTTDQAGIVSKIASILIKGQVIGTTIGGDHFGFVAQQIGSFKTGSTSFKLQSGPANDDLDANDPLLLVGATGDVRVREVST